MEAIKDTINTTKYGKYDPDAQIEVRDMRNGDWYWIHKSIINDYGEIIKAGGIAIYNILALHVNSRNQKCYPGIRRMAMILGCGHQAVIRKIKQMEDLKLIKVERQTGHKSIYTLLKISVSTQKHLKKAGLPEKRGRVTTETLPGSPQKRNNNKKQELNNKKDSLFPFKKSKQEIKSNTKAIAEARSNLKKTGVLS